MQNGEEVIEVAECGMLSASVQDELIEDKLLNALRLVVPNTVEGSRIKQMRDFIDSNLMTVDKSTAKAFIENDMFNHFMIMPKSPNRSIVKEYFRDEFKLRNAQKQQKEAVKKVENTPCIPESCRIDKEFAGLYQIEINENTGSIRIRAFLDKIGRRVIKNVHAISYKENMYCFKDGRYIESEKVVEAEALRILSGIYKKEYSTGVKKNLADVMKYVVLESVTTEYPFNQTKMALNVKNGVIVFDKDGTYRLEESDPEKYKFNYILPVTYDDCAESEYIMSEMAKYTEKPDMLIQILAQVMIQAIGYGPQKIAYVLYGPADYGKSSLLRIYRYFFEKLYSQIPLNRMSTETDNRFVFAPMEGKLMNIADEMTYFKMSDTNSFKDITGSYDIWVEHKGFDPYAALSVAVQLMATNKTPSFDGRVKDDSAFWKRIQLIPITKTKFSISDDFDKRVLTEENMSGLLNVTLAMVSAFVTGTPLKYHSHNGDDWENTREEWMQAGNPLYKFMCDNMVRGGQTSIVRFDLLKVVQKWCDDGNILNRKSRPEDIKGLTDTIRLCNGKFEEKKKSFYKATPSEMSKRIMGVKKSAEHNYMETEEKYCYVLPWTWKTEKDENDNVIENKYAMECRKAFREEKEEEE